MSKRRMWCVLLVMLMSLTFSINAYATEISMGNTTGQNGDQITTRAEQVRWYHRIHNGVKQRRLWSITYGYWKTNWIKV